MAPFDLEDLLGRGFAGFLPVAQLAASRYATVPLESGTYVVLRAKGGAPAFLERGRGGWWKGRDPTVPVERLEREWVHGAQTVYIGKAASLRERVGLLVTFASGEPVMHWGGRLLWQLERGSKTPK